MSFEFREELLARLARLPGQIEAEDIPDLVTLAQVCRDCLKDRHFKYFQTYG